MKLAKLLISALFKLLYAAGAYWGYRLVLAHPECFKCFFLMGNPDKVSFWDVPPTALGMSLFINGIFALLSVQNPLNNLPIFRPISRAIDRQLGLEKE